VSKVPKIINPKVRILILSTSNFKPFAGRDLQSRPFQTMGFKIPFPFNIRITNPNEQCCYITGNKFPVCFVVSSLRDFGVSPAGPTHCCCLI